MRVNGALEQLDYEVCLFIQYIYGFKLYLLLQTAFIRYRADVSPSYVLTQTYSNHLYPT